MSVQKCVFKTQTSQNRIDRRDFVIKALQKHKPWDVTNLFLPLNKIKKGHRVLHCNAFQSLIKEQD